VEGLHPVRIQRGEVEQGRKTPTWSTRMQGGGQAAAVIQGWRGVKQGSAYANTGGGGKLSPA